MQICRGVARNPILFDAFYRLGITEKIGSGINRMREAMAARNIEIEFDTGGFFIVTLARQTATPQVTEQVTEQAEKSKEFLKFCTTPKSTSEIMDFLGLKHREHFRAKILQPLLRQGLLKPTIPDKPTSSRQKYYATKEKK